MQSIDLCTELKMPVEYFQFLSDRPFAPPAGRGIVVPIKREKANRGSECNSGENVANRGLTGFRTLGSRAGAPVVLVLRSGQAI